MFGRSKFDFSFILDSELNIVESDRTTIRVFGLPSDTKLHKLWSFLSVCNTSEKVYEVLCKQSTISDFTKRAGEIQLQFLPVLDNFVKYSVRGIIKDIKFASGTVDQSTDTERNDDEFILNGARFDAIVNSMNCGLIIEDDQRKIVLANSQFCKMFYIPVPPHYLNGGNCSEALKQSSHLFKYPELVIDQVLKLLDEKIEKLGDEVYMSDGKIMERDYIPIYINQNYKGHLWVYRDITSIKMVSTKESVNTISQLLLSVGSTQQIYTKIPRIISERFNFPIVSINLYNSHDNRITPVGSIGFPEVESTPKFGLNESFDCHGTVFGHCVTMGTSVYYPPVLDENLILPVPGVEKIENYICLPLKGENSQIGCLFLANNARHYHSDEILINTANLIASAIEREMNKLELITARDQALESVKLKSQFVANISHELRTPLNSVIGMCDIILSTKLDSDQQSCAETIKMSSNILLTVINEILNFSKLEAGKIEITIDDFDIRETVEGVTAMLWGVAKERDIMMNCFVPVNFPSWGRCDSVKVSEILVNLIGNAIKFTHSGYVYVCVFQVESNIRIEVRDTGIGIDSSSMGLLYRPFTQVDGSRTRRHTGTGLGLCISKQMVEMLGGNIGVESKKGCGSTFWVEFPWKQAVTMAPDRILIPESFPIKEFVNLSAVIITSNVTLKEWTSELCKELGIKINYWEDQFPTENLNDYIDRSLKLLKVDFIFVDNQLITNPLLYWNVKFGILTKSHTQSNTLIHQSPHGFIETPFKLRKIIETIKNLIDSTSNAPTRSISLKINNESEKSAFGNYRVLIVEDNLMNIKMLVRLLNKEGISNIDVAEDGEKGVAFCSQNDYDLVFMDCHMPILDGFEASKMIRNKEFEKKSNRSVPIVAATANVMPSDIELCYRSGMDDFVAKPITAESVRTVLKKFLL